MRPSEIRNLPALLAVSLLLCAIVLAQDPKQELNDQFFEATRKGDAAAVAALLDKGVDVNAKFRYGTTALFKAAERGHTEVVKVLLAHGADVTVQDTFYHETAMGWALQNNHIEVVRLLLEKDKASIEPVLMNGVREGNKELVTIALAAGAAKPETLTMALAAAMDDKDKSEITEMLKKAGAVPPPEIDAATLQSYVGKYKGDPGPEISITLAQGKLSAIVIGQRPFVLMAVNNTTFKPAAFEGITITFAVEAGKVTGFALKQGPTTTQLKRLEETKQP
jgi:ankyrin repeat protein